MSVAPRHPKALAIVGTRKPLDDNKRHEFDETIEMLTGSRFAANFPREADDRRYVGFIVIMLGFLLQWPTLLTLLMFPVLVVMYVLLARREALREFGDQYRTCMR